ncbi:hypothetical protein CRP01_06855 [Flavilitoribacter nigricans DSM 23189 = NBRC 102662]|uniref:Uncharacterized protein n=1 Tax=Flavilitoribacter nigricans (strain ATCC 23147 / DSM 23189 / NBRC 102662 / NCIMB 1420 / SS-2) TaxID=1122177 RepID=A0A2D0NFR9_FLAN2|nr:hypothetical protein CRP01_06855 [Flavilitoribacter nigricans DSM 23189 = NBRC 102662]
MPVAVWGQTDLWQNQRSRVLLPTSDTLLLDTFTIIPNSILIRDTLSKSRIDTSTYRTDGRFIYWKKRPITMIRIDYRVFPFDIGRPAQRLDTSRIANEEGILMLDYNPFEKDEPAIDFKGLQYNGSFARGISFGNSQDLVLNSRFNLQMAGEIGDGIEVAAAITDENIPLQAEGNTQQLREFDKVFIRLRKDNNQLIAGDYELQRPQGYFMNYFKKLQGATFSNRLDLTEEASLTSNASVAVARGQFTRNRIVAQEGNQGPYKLRGAQGERFIIVLAGTEKVWIDNELMQRGLEQDYIINYDRGELTFTHRRLITKDSRIVVEFEYSDREYVRSLYAINSNYQNKRASFYVNMFSQQDSRNATGDTPLSDADKLVLSQAGDDLGLALVSTIDTLDQTAATRATYELIDTSFRCGGVDSVFQYLRYETDPERGRYVARFTFVGAGNGAYELDPENIANEKVYRWVGYDTLSCQPAGSYEPIRQLTAPQQQRMLTAGGALQIKGGNLRAEVAYSQLDLNRFSNLDNANDRGVAVFSQLERSTPLGADSSKWQLYTDLSYEYKAATFQPLNPYRSPDFLRDWNLVDIQGQGTVEQADEHLGLAGIALQRRGLGELGYRLSTFLRDELYNGWRHRANLDLNTAGWQVNGLLDWVNTEESTKNTSLSRPRLNIRKTFEKLGGWSVGWQAEREKSERYGIASDTLQANSFFYDRHRLFLRSPQQDNFQLEMSYRDRQDYAPVIREFSRSSRAKEGNLNGTWNARNEVHQFTLTGNLSYRQLSIQDQELTDQDPAETFLGRFDINTNLWKGVLRTNTTYEIGSGQEPKVEFTYARVTPGSGTHIWLDSLYNNDGKIQFNEMEIAPFQDLADYVRISVITDDFIRTDNAGLNQSISIDPRRIWRSATGFRKFLGRFSTLSNLQINRKTRASDAVNAWNPLQLNVPDTALVALNANMRNTLFFNRANPDFSLQLGQSDNRNRIVQTTGYESRRLSEYFLQGRANFSTALSSEVKLSWGEKASDSEFFNNRDYTLAFRELEPEVTYLPSRNFRLIFNYKFRQDRNVLSGGGDEEAVQHNLGLEGTFRPGQSSYGLSFSYINVDFTGATNSPVGFAILNGLQRGENFLWNINLNRQLSKNIQLSLSYEGRKTGTAGVVHVGRAQVAATF